MARYCTKCGKQLSDASKFCDGCGAKVEAVQQPTRPTKRFCTKCGNEIKDGTAFCTRCGAAVRSANATENNMTPPRTAEHKMNTASAPSRQAQPPVQPMNQATQPTNQATQPTNQAAQPTNQAAQPTNQAAQPTYRAAQSTNQAAQSTNQAAQPMNRAAQQTNQATQRKGGKGFFSELWSEMLDLFKHPTKLIPTFVLAAVWLIMPLVTGFAAGANTPIVRFICTLTYANGGILGGFFGTVGGIFGKAVFAAVVNGFVLSLCEKKNPFKGFKKGIGGVFAGGLRAVAPLLSGAGIGLVSYWLFNITSAPQNSAVAVVAAIAAIQSIGKQNGLLFGGAFYLLKKLSRGKAPSRITVNRLMTGLAAGFSIGFGLTFLRYAWLIVLIGVLFIGAGIGITFVGMNGMKKTAAAAALVLMLGGLLVPLTMPVSASPKDGYPYTNNKYFRYGMSYGIGQKDTETGKYTYVYDIKIMSRGELETIEKDKVTVEATKIPRLSEDSYSFHYSGLFYCEESEQNITCGITVNYGEANYYSPSALTQDALIEEIKESLPDWTYTKITVGGYPAVRVEHDGSTQSEGFVYPNTEGRIYIIVDDVLVPNSPADEDDEYHSDCPILSFTYSLDTNDSYSIDEPIGTVATYDELFKRSRQKLNAWIDDFISQVKVVTTYDENIIDPNYKYDNSSSGGKDKDDGYVPYRGRLTYTNGRVNKHGQPFPDLMDFNNDGYIDYADREILQKLVHNPDYLDTPEGAALVLVTIATTAFGVGAGTAAGVAGAAAGSGSSLGGLNLNIEFPEDEEREDLGRYITRDSDGDLNVSDPATGEKRLYKANGDGTYTNPLTGATYTADELKSSLDSRAENADLIRRDAEGQKEWLDEERRRSGELSSYGKQVAENERLAKEQQAREDYLHQVGARNGVYSGDEAEIKETLTSRMEKQEEIRDKYIEYADRMDTLTTAAELTKTTADIAADVVGTMDKTGVFKDVYSATTAAAGNVGEVMAGNMTVEEAAAKTAVDASTEVIKNRVKGVGSKFAANIGGDAAKSATAAIIDGESTEDVLVAAAEGGAKGAVNATIDIGVELGNKNVAKAGLDHLTKPGEAFTAGVMKSAVPDVDLPDVDLSGDDDE